MTRISDRIALERGLLSSPEISSKKNTPTVDHLAAQACMLLLPTARRQEAKGDRREMIGCMRPLLRATDRIRGGGSSVAWNADRI